jgi:phosphoserine phosphatase RsbU/P
MQSSIIQAHIAANTKTLIIDDNDITRKILKKWCVSNGFVQIEEAVNGKEGLQKAIDWQPNLIFLDVNMPEMDGMTMLMELQKYHLNDDKVIMMQTVVDDVASKSRAFELGVTDFINKPLHQREVMSRTIAHVERQYLHNVRLREAMRHKEELKQAGVLQNMLMPQSKILQQIRNNLDIDISYYYKPADLVSGDYCGVRLLDNDNICVLIADVAGHGISSALYTFSLHAMIEYIFHSHVETNLALTELNRELFKHFPTGKFATMFMGLINPAEQIVQYSTAACPEPLLISNNKVQYLDSKGYLLGSIENADYELRNFKWQAGDLLLLYSDALIENYLDNDKAMSQKHLSEIVQQNKHLPAKEILHKLTNEFFSHYNSNLIDDLTLLLCKF